MNTRGLDIRAHNAAAWNSEVALHNPWTIPVDPQTVRRARGGDFDLYVSPTRPVPRQWLPLELVDVPVLCLAGGGGQQGPLLAAAGARVTVLDNSERQLEQDRSVARRDGLDLVTVQGDMADLSMFAADTFELIVNPPSNVYVADVRPVWREAFRVLRSGGILIAGFDNPVRHIFDTELAERGVLRVRHRLPYSDVNNLTPAELRRRLDSREPLQFGHLWEDQIGGQIDAGFAIAGFFEDRFSAEEGDALSDYLPTFAATRALKASGVPRDREPSLT